MLLTDTVPQTTHLVHSIHDTVLQLSAGHRLELQPPDASAETFVGHLLPVHCVQYLPFQSGSMFS